MTRTFNIYNRQKYRSKIFNALYTVTFDNFFIRERYEEGIFMLEYICTDNMVADVFTKALSTQRFNLHRANMNVIKK